MIAPLLPELPALTHSSSANVSWLLTTTLLTGAIATPLLGRMGDMYGKKRMLMITLAVLAAGSLTCALSSDLAVLIIGRGLQGAALAVIPLGISILRDELPPARVIGAVALMSSTLGVGAAVGLPVAALIVQGAGWHTMFWACAAFAAVAVLCVHFVVPESGRRSAGQFDFLGALGLATMLTCLMLAINKGGDWGWTAPRTLGLLIGAVAIGLVWGRYELRTPTPMVDLRVSARPAVLLTNLAAFLIGFAFYANALTTAQLVQEPTSTGYGIGATMLVSSLCLLPGGICMALFSPVSARISARHGAKSALALASGVLALGYVVRIFTSGGIAMIIVGATVVSIGTALAYSALPTLIMGSVPVSETGAANGMNTLVRTIGQTVCAAVAVLVLSHVTSTRSGRELPSLAAYLTIFGIAAAVSLAALVATLLIPRRKGEGDPGTGSSTSHRKAAPATTPAGLVRRSAATVGA
ncbi:MFS transporter [Nakamurella silvestris]|nr:MFS transporter [Nakamurella silvestris]